jgi:hypothetical protein
MQLLPLISPLLCNYRHCRCYATIAIAIDIAVAMQLLPLQLLCKPGSHLRWVLPHYGTAPNRGQCPSHNPIAIWPSIRRYRGHSPSHKFTAKYGRPQDNTTYSIQHTAHSIRHTAYSIQHTAYTFVPSIAEQFMRATRARRAKYVAAILLVTGLAASPFLVVNRAEAWHQALPPGPQIGSQIRSAMWLQIRFANPVGATPLW